MLQATAPNIPPSRFFYRFVLPCLLLTGLWLSLIQGILIPTIERNLTQEKRTHIRELTQTAWRVLHHAHALQKNGELTETQAQELAVRQINDLRYGDKMKDYFWVIDMQPRMITHPYKPQLNGSDLSNYRDPHGQALFIDCVDIVKNSDNHEGYLQYSWQKHDNPDQMAPKLSFVKSFEPWQWIVGTGIYLNDVQAQIRTLTHHLYAICGLITVIFFLLLYFLLSQSHRSESQRQTAQKGLIEAKEKYQSLVESATQALLILLDGHYNFSNQATQQLLGYTHEDLRQIHIERLFTQAHRRDALYFLRLLSGKETPRQMESTLRHKDGHAIPVHITVSSVTLQDKTGYAVIATHTHSDTYEEQLSALRTLVKRQQITLLELQSELRIGGGELDWNLLTQAPDKQTLAIHTKRFHQRIKTLADNGMNIDPLARMTTRVTDITTQRLVYFALESLGPAPVPFAFLAMGSEGRSEQSLKTDQDNGIVYLDPTDNQDNAHYFQKLGVIVCDGLYDAGYPYCPGGNMANNPEWCLPQHRWQDLFQQWIFKATPNDLLRLNIFFDFRAVFGEEQLASNLMESIHASVDKNPSFLGLLADNALKYKVPSNLLGRVRLRDPDKTTLNIKDALQPLIQFTRIYALRHHIQNPNTLDRLDLLHTNGHLHHDTWQSATQAYRELMHMRFSHQSDAIDQGLDPDNDIDPNTLENIQRSTLRKALEVIPLLQTKLRFDFKGGQA